MDRLSKMEEFLNTIAEEIQNTEEYSMDNVYDNLCTYGLTEEDVIVKEEDVELIEGVYYGHGEMTKKAVVREIKAEAKLNGNRWLKTIQFPRLRDWSHTTNKGFMYFRDRELRDNFDEFTSQSNIKMYIPVGKIGAIKLLHVLIAELEGFGTKREGVKHESKLSSRIRTDDFVVRVNTREEAERISDFINSKNPYPDLQIEKFSDVLIEPNPFVLQENNIGYTSDRSLSYNANVANMIYEYVNDLKMNNELDKVSVAGLESFVKEKYKSLFIEGENLEQYRNEQFDYERNESFEKWLMNKMEVMDMFLIALNPENGLEKFYEHYDDINNVGYNKELEVYFTGLINAQKGKMPLKPSQYKKEEKKMGNEILEDVEKEEIDVAEFADEFEKSGEKDYYAWLWKKYEEEKEKGNLKQAEHIMDVFRAGEEAAEEHQRYIIEENYSYYYGEYKKSGHEGSFLGYMIDKSNSAIDSLDRQSYVEVIEYIKEKEKEEEAKKKEEQATEKESPVLEDMSETELEEMIAQNETTISENDKTIKEELIKTILQQQATIKEQEQEINRLKSERAK